MSEAEEKISLRFKDGSSDKEYHAQITKEGDGYLVKAQYGRTGGALKEIVKTPAPVPYEKAKKEFDKLVRDKTSKGYTPDGSGVAFVGTNNEERITGLIPQLLNPIDPEDVQGLDGDDWWVQEKHDGERRMVRITENDIILSNRKGLRVGARESVHNALLAVQQVLGPLTLDAEDMGDKGLVVFDVIEGFSVNRDMPFEKRNAALAHFATHITTMGLEDEITVDVAVPLSEFRANDAETALREGLAEGYVLKRADAPYVPGRPNSGGSQVKIKFIEDCTCRAVRVKDAKRSIGLEALDADTREWVFVGNVTVPANQDIPETGDFVDVKYLYAYPNGSLFQPVLKGKRADADDEACLTSKLKYKRGTAPQPDQPEAESSLGM